MKKKAKKPNNASEAILLTFDPNSSKGEFKQLGGSQADEWNGRLNNLTINALPRSNGDQITEAALAVSYGVADISPADPIEGILIAQLMAANEAALEMYRKGWGQPPEFFETRTKYLQLADKAARTVDADGTARSPPRPRAATNHRQARHHEQRHRGSGDYCR